MPDAAVIPYVTAHRELSSRLAGTGVPWLRRLREQALEHFSSGGFPTTRDEDWKYTDLRAVTREPFVPATRGDALAFDPGVVDRCVVAALEAARMTFVNGYFHAGLSAVPEGGGLTAASLAAVLESGPDRVEGRLGSLAPFEPRGFNALNTAFMSDGAYLEVGPHSRPSRPIELLYLSAPGESRFAGQPRNLIVARAGSQLQLVERHVAAGSAQHLSNLVTEIILEAGAQIDHVIVHEDGDQAYRIGGVYVHQDGQSRYTAHCLTLGGRLVRTNLHVVQAGEGAVSRLNGLYLGGGRRHIDYHTRIVHEAAGGVSRELFKGILGDRSRAVFHGRIIVRPGAQKTDSEQRNQNLLLSREAEVDTKPQLEIYADDVKCSHGATVGQLDADAVFYLRSRGIGEIEARGLLTLAFAGEVLGALALEPLRRYLEARIAAAMALPAPTSGAHDS